MGLICAALISVASGVFFPAGIAPSVLTDWIFWVSAGIFLLDLLLALKKISPIALIGLSAALGVGLGYLGEYLGLM